MDERKPKGPYILWIDYGCEGWAPLSFDSLSEALDAVGMFGCGTWVITMAPLVLVAKDLPSLTPPQAQEE